MPRGSLVVVVLGSVVSLALACGGADKQDVLDAPSASTGSSGTTSTSGGATSGGTTSGGTTSSGGADGGTSSGGAGCESETEPNDNENQANLLSSSLCGQIGTNSDVDFLTFTLPMSAKTMKLTFDGPVTLKVSVDGANSVTLKAGSTQGVPFVKGKPYFIEVQGTKGASWRVNLSVQ